LLIVYQCKPGARAYRRGGAMCLSVRGVPVFADWSPVMCQSLWLLTVCV
jgi:hypothetical protein